MISWLFPARARAKPAHGTLIVSLADLSRPKRNAIIAERKHRVTAALERCVARGLSSPLPPRDQVVAGVRNRSTKGDRS